MTSIKILNETFKSDGVNYRGTEVGTVDIDLGFGKVVTARAIVAPAIGLRDAGLDVAGFVGRYQTSPKPWPASVTGHGDKLWVHFGRDDRSGRFNKLNALRWEPETFAQIANIAYWQAAAL